MAEQWATLSVPRIHTCEDVIGCSTDTADMLGCVTARNNCLKFTEPAL